MNTHVFIYIFIIFVYNLYHPSAIKKWFSRFHHLKVIYISIPVGISWFLILAWKLCTWVKKLGDLKIRPSPVFLPYVYVWTERSMTSDRICYGDWCRPVRLPSYTRTRPMLSTCNVCVFAEYYNYNQTYIVLLHSLSISYRIT